jgi:hypothetical protein
MQDDKMQADMKEDSEGFSRIKTSAERPPAELPGRAECGFCSPEAGLTSENCRSTLKALGVMRAVKQLRSISVLFLLVVAVFVSVVPRADAPETTFNEADAPVNLAPPARLGSLVVLPSVDPVVVMPAVSPFCPTCAVSNVVPDRPAVPRQRHGHSLQSLLCTLLI